MTYNLNGKVIRIPDADIEKSMKLLKLSHDEAVQMWLEDEGYLENEVVEEAAKLMIDNEIGCVPVVENDVVVGIVTESDLFQLFTNMFGARYNGVRANFYMKDKPGELACLAAKVAEAKGNVIAIVTRESEKAGTRRVTLKATDITLDAMKSIISESNAELIDIRMI